MNKETATAELIRNMADMAQSIKDKIVDGTSLSEEKINDMHYMLNTLSYAREELQKKNANILTAVRLLEEVVDSIDKFNKENG